jgi:hypothetical protein
MDTQAITERLKAKGVKARGHIHSEHHALADKLCKELGDPKHFGAFLRIAQTHNHQKILQILGQVLDNPKVQHKPSLFMYLIKNNK